MTPWPRGCRSRRARTHPTARRRRAWPRRDWRDHRRWTWRVGQCRGGASGWRQGHGGSAPPPG
eukprot:2408471-Prymnesium_polylepis.1